MLAPGGIFVNAEQVGGPSDAWTAVYEARWASDAAAQGASEAEISDALLRRTHDRCASVPDHLGWLTAAGFGVVDCPYKNGETAVLVAMK